MAHNSGKPEKDEDQITKEVVQYILNRTEKDEINNECKLASPEIETTSNSGIMHQPIHLAGNNQSEINYDGDDEKDVDGDSDDEDSVDVFAQKSPFVSGRLSSNNDPSTSNNTTLDKNLESGRTSNNNGMSNDTEGRTYQLLENKNTVAPSILGINRTSTLYIQSESDEYQSSDSDDTLEITIDNDKVIDDRNPDQDHVKERILYCDSCIKRDADVSESEIYVTCLCFDCETYLCLACSRNCTDAGHLIALTEDNESERGDIYRKFIERLSSEDEDNMIASMNRERFDRTGKLDAADQDEEPNKLNITGVCYTEDGSKIALIDKQFLKLFNGYSYKLIRVIEFSDVAYGITEVHCNIVDYTPEKVSYFAITFPGKGQIVLVDTLRPDPIVTYLQLDEEERNLWPRDINHIEHSTLMVLCPREDDEGFSVEIIELLSPGSLAHIDNLDIESLPGPATAGEYYLWSEFKFVVHKESGAYFISSETNGYIKHMTYNSTNIRHAVCKAFVSNPAVHSIICVDKKKNVFAFIGNESHEYGIYKSDENLKIWKLCIPASEYIAGNSTLGMVHKDRLFLLTKSEDGRQYITIFQNEVSDRGYGEGSPL